MNITGSRDGKVFFIDNDKVMIDGKMYYEKSPQSLPKADAYSLLADVRAWLKQIQHPVIFLVMIGLHGLNLTDGVRGVGVKLASILK